MRKSRLRFFFTDSRWNWFLRGLPSLNRARTLFLARNYTMGSAVRCKALWEICQNILKQNIPGVFVECGVWRGGSAAMMGLAIKNHCQDRPLHLFDSFEGLPEPEAEDGAEAIKYSGNKGSGKLISISRCEASLESVQNYLLKELRLDEKNVHFHVGWFQETVPVQANKISNIAVLRLDGDWYASTKVCLEHLYPLLSPSGAIILDDYYCWEGCKKATDEFRSHNGISTPIIQIDEDCGYWLKES